MAIPTTVVLGDNGHVQDHNDISGVLTDHESRILAVETDFAPLDSPAFTGIPTAPTAASGTNTTQIATTEFVSTAVTNLIDSAPETLDTLNELAAAINDNATFFDTVAPKDSPVFTGSITLDSKANTDTSSTTISVNTATTIDTLDGSTYRSCEYLVQVTQGTKYTVSKIIMLHDGTTANISEYSVIEIGSPVIPLTISATMSGTDVLLQATVTDASSTNASVEVLKSALVV